MNPTSLSESVIELICELGVVAIIFGVIAIIITLPG